MIQFQPWSTDFSEPVSASPQSPTALLASILNIFKITKFFPEKPTGYGPSALPAHTNPLLSFINAHKTHTRGLLSPLKGRITSQLYMSYSNHHTVEYQRIYLVTLRSTPSLRTQRNLVCSLGNNTEHHQPLQ